MVMPVEDCALNWWGLHHILRHVSWAKIRATGFGMKLSLYIYTLFEKDTFEEGVLVS